MQFSGRPTAFPPLQSSSSASTPADPQIALSNPTDGSDAGDAATSDRATHKAAPARSKEELQRILAESQARNHALYIESEAAAARAAAEALEQRRIQQEKLAESLKEQRLQLEKMIEIQRQKKAAADAKRVEDAAAAKAELARVLEEKALERAREKERAEAKRKQEEEEEEARRREEEVKKAEAAATKLVEIEAKKRKRAEEERKRRAKKEEEIRMLDALIAEDERKLREKLQAKGRPTKPSELPITAPSRPVTSLSTASTAPSAPASRATSARRDPPM